MIEKVVEIVNREGMHTRPSSEIVKVTWKYKSDIYFEYSNMLINAKSVIGIMSIGATKGSKILIKIDGLDENEAMKELVELFADGFGEI
jgi:phosphocarrier protein HPr